MKNIYPLNINDEKYAAWKESPYPLLAKLMDYYVQQRMIDKHIGGVSIKTAG